MKLSEKQKALLDRACREKLGAGFDSIYNMLFLQEQQKAQEKSSKKG